MNDPILTKYDMVVSVCAFVWVVVGVCVNT
jgi:hypothetical protein